MEKKKFLIGALIAVLLVVSAAFASSCGGKEVREGKAPEEESGIQVEVSNRSDVDSLLKDLDASMNSVGADDFSDSQLSDTELGL